MHKLVIIIITYRMIDNFRRMVYPVESVAAAAAIVGEAELPVAALADGPLQVLIAVVVVEDVAVPVHDAIAGQVEAVAGPVQIGAGFVEEIAAGTADMMAGDRGAAAAVAEIAGMRAGDTRAAAGVAENAGMRAGNTGAAAVVVIVADTLKIMEFYSTLTTN